MADAGQITFKFPCPHCGQRIEADVQWGGLESFCPTCKEAFIIPEISLSPLPKKSQKEPQEETTPKKSSTPPKTRSRRNKSRDLNIFERALDWASQGRYLAYREHPFTQKQRVIRDCYNKATKILAEMAVAPEDLTSQNRRAAQRLNESRQQEELRAVSVDDLKSIPGVGDGRIESLRSAGINNLHDLKDNTASLRSAPGMAGKTGNRVMAYVKKKIAEIANEPPYWDSENPEVQDLLCNLLLEENMHEQLSKVRAFRDQIKTIKNQRPAVNFLTSFVLQKQMQEDSIASAATSAQELLTSLKQEPNFRTFSFRDLSTKEYLQGLSLLEKKCLDQGQHGRNYTSPQFPAVHPFLKLDSRLVEAIEKLELDTSQMRHCVLRRYQEFASKFIVVQKHVAIGDEMGLGKTIQVLGAISHLWENADLRRVLIVAPASLSENWRREIGDKTALPHFTVLGPQRQHSFVNWLEAGGIGITSYETLRNDLEKYENIVSLDMIVADEAQFIKNPGAMRSVAVKKLLPKAKFAVVMTGTPVENHPGEFIHILNCLTHDIKDLRQLGDGRTWPVPSKFRKMTSSIYLRRNKDDVLKELPDLIDTQEWVLPSNKELKQHLEDIRSGMHIMKIRHRIITAHGEESTKLRRIMELIEDYRENDRNLVVFSFYRLVLDIIKRLEPDAFVINGDVSPAERMRIIDEFSEPLQNGGGRLLLSQINAGGTGLNMQAASGVILVEPHFNPAIEYQAICRAHRMGQRSAVNVHRIIAEQTIEEDMVDLLAIKRKLMDDYGRESALKESSKSAISEADVESVKHEREQKLTTWLKAA